MITENCVFHATEADKPQAHAGSNKNRERCKIKIVWI